MDFCDSFSKMREELEKSFLDSGITDECLEFCLALFGVGVVSKICNSFLNVQENVVKDNC